MNTGASWIPFHHDQQTLPSLFVNFAPCDHHGYTVKLTDLTRIWEETLSDVDISGRAEQDNCTINPAGDAKQLDILISKIKLACYRGPGTSIKLDCKPASDDLSLLLNVPLPAPLQPLSWRMNLSLADTAALTESVLFPLLSFAHTQKNDIKSLQTQLQQKDYVIGKLLDRMESANVRLDSAFLLPHVTVSKKVPQRELFAKHVPGLAVYRPDIGRDLATVNPSPEDVYAVLQDMPSHEAEALSIRAEQNWWRQIEDVSQGALLSSVPSSTPVHSNTNIIDSESAITESPPPLPPPDVKARPTQRKLGVLGGSRGRAQATNPNDVQKTVSSTDEDTSVPASANRSQPVPHISNMLTERLRPGKPEDHEREVKAGIANDDKPECSTRIRETSEERANTKREELKRQLEGTTKGPTKKKRKF